MACGILVPQPQIGHRHIAMNALRPNHWTARESPQNFTFISDNSRKWAPLKYCGITWWLGEWILKLFADYV